MGLGRTMCKFVVWWGLFLFCVGPWKIDENESSVLSHQVILPQTSVYGEGEYTGENILHIAIIHQDQAFPGEGGAVFHSRRVTRGLGRTSDQGCWTLPHILRESRQKF